MKKIVIISKIIAILCTLVLVIGLITTFGSEKEPQNEEQKTVVEAVPSETEEPKEEITEFDVRKQKAQLEILQDELAGLEAEKAIYEQWKQDLSQEEMDKLIQSEIIRCYEENVLLAIEAKTLVMGSFDVSVPTGFADGDAVMSSYEDYLSSSVLDIVLSQVATDDVKDILKNGVDGAVEAYEQQGNLTDVLTGAVSSTANGVVAKVQDNIKGEVIDIIDETTGGLASIVTGLAESGSVEEYLKGLADNKTGGLIGSISGILNYDKTPTALLQNLSNSANESSKQVQTFLEKETITSVDISEMMYQYSQFGNALDSLRSYGGNVSYNWQNNYEKMEIIYERFVRNEMMIEILGTEGAANE